MNKDFTYEDVLNVAANSFLAGYESAESGEPKPEEDPHAIVLGALVFARAHTMALESAYPHFAKMQNSLEALKRLLEQARADEL